MHVDRIINFKPVQLVFSKEEKKQMVNLVERFAAEYGMGAALTALWEQQKAIGFVLGNPSKGQNLDDESKLLQKKTGRHWLIHSRARQDRKNIPFLTKCGILAEHPKFVYEKLEDECYCHHPTKKHNFTEICFLCSAQTANPNEILISADLGDAEFVYGANYATLGHCHFTVWTKVPILQKYWPEDTLLWLREHSKRLVSDSYTTFFNGLGAGNSIKHFHYQTLREDFPILRSLTQKQFPGTSIVRLEWPIPAYLVKVSLENNRIDDLFQLDGFICKWLNMHCSHTLNLVCSADSSEKASVVFIPRVDSPEKRRPSKFSNDFAGCEVGGRINIEKLDEWKQACQLSEPEIAELMSSLAPPKKQIDALEAVF